MSVPSEKPVDQRETLRISLSIQGRLSEPYQGQHDVELIDISPTGARIATYRRFHVGNALYLSIGNLQRIKCEVRWTEPGEIGVVFASSLHPSVVDHIAATNRSAR